MTTANELEKLANKIIKIGDELKQIDVNNVSQEDVEKATKMLKDFKIIVDKKQRELYKIWQKIEEAEE